MNKILQERAADACALLLGAALGTILAPIDASAPAGASLRANGVYQAIAQARRADDPSLPMGAWQHELKRADWDQVTQLAVDALSYQGKDLQVAAWLMEAQIHRNGFAALAASLHLIDQLMERYWDELYPLADEGGLEHRANVVRWMNEKLQPALRQVPLTEGTAPRFAYADWERLRRRDQAGEASGGAEGVGLTELGAAVAATSTSAFVALDGDLEAALDALATLSRTVGTRFAPQAPSLSGLDDLLRQIRALVLSELHQRGIRPADGEQPAPDAPPESGAPPPPVPVVPGTIGNREQAYAVLELAADFLLRTEPHSPVPYLVRRASSWGQLNAGQLYHELFLRLGGQLNIFEVMGLQVDPPLREGN